MTTQPTISYLDAFLSAAEDAPQDLRRNLQHMRALDTEGQDLVERIRKLAKVHVTRAKRSVADGVEPSEELLHKVRGLHRKMEEIGNEKVNLATQIHDMVDRHMRRLNEDLAKFEQELDERGKLKGATVAGAAGSAAADGGAGPDGAEDGAVAGGGGGAGGGAQVSKKGRGSSKRRSGKGAKANTAAADAAASSAAPKAYRSGSASGARAPTKRKSESLELDLDLGPELIEEATPGQELLYPAFQLPLASKEDASKPLCGAIPAEDGATHPAGAKVAARVSQPKVVPQEWILATVSKWAASAGKYIVTDDDDPSGQTVHTLPPSALAALPVSEPPTFTRAHEYKEGTTVLGMYPDTTCFYKAVVTIAPSKRRERDYIVEFEDDVDINGHPTVKRVPVKYVVPWPSR